MGGIEPALSVRPLAAGAARSGSESPSEFFQEIKAGSLHLIGISYATLIHNEGWWFAQAGKFLERADKTSRILDVRYQTPARTRRCRKPSARPTRSNGRRSCARAARGTPTNPFTARKCIPRLVAEFLLFNEDFPRSVRFCVSELNRALRRISGVAEGRFCNDAEKLAGRLVAELQFSTVDEIFEQGLHDYLDQLQIKLNDIGARAV